MSTKKALPGTPEYKWTDAQRAKFRATMKAKKASGWKLKQPKTAKQMPRVWQEQKSNGHAVHDAIGWLRYGEESATRRLREGKIKRYDESHIFLMLALRALEGGGKMRVGDVIAIIGMGLVLLLFAYGAVFIVRSGWVHARCLEMSYAESDMDWRFTAYCVQRDYRGVMKAIPLEELR